MPLEKIIRQESEFSSSTYFNTRSLRLRQGYIGGTKLGVRRMTFWLWGTAAIFSLLLADSAAAQAPNRDVDHCKSKDPEISIAGCTALIQSGQGGLSLDVILYYRGGGYRATGEYDSAIQDFDRSIQLNPKSASTFINRGIAYKNKGQFDRAIADYDQALVLQPDSAIAYTDRGLAYEKKEQYDRALQDYDKAINLDPRAEI